MKQQGQTTVKTPYMQTLKTLEINKKYYSPSLQRYSRINLVFSVLPAPLSPKINGGNIVKIM
jgi:hypothetical protein